MRHYRSYSAENTKKIARDLAARVLARGVQKSGAIIIALEGELGAGKTTFVQGFFKGLGLRRVPNSPTFILMRRSHLKNKKFRNAYHVDAYRIHSSKDAAGLNLPALFKNPESIFLIEWPEKIKTLLPKKRIGIRLIHGKKESERRIKLSHGG